MFYYKLKKNTGKILGLVSLWRWRKDIMKTGGIVKQTCFVKNLHGKNLTLFKIITCKHDLWKYIKISDIFLGHVCLYSSFYVKLNNIQ